MEAAALPAAATNVRPRGGAGRCDARMRRGSAAPTAAWKLSSRSSRMGALSLYRHVLDTKIAPAVALIQSRILLSACAAPLRRRIRASSRSWEVAVAKMIHAMIRVLDLERSMRFYRDAFGLETSSRLDFPEFSLVYLRNPENDFELELTLNRGRTEPYTHGTGYGHVAVCVDDVAGEHARVKSLGLAPNDIKEFRDGERLLARFFFMQDPDGYKIEVLQRHGHYA